LAEPQSSVDPAFHVVVPSLPGFAWSKGPPTKKPGIGDADGYCRVLDTLMMDVLGYSAYAAQGGDWGSIHARCLGAKFARPDGRTGCRAVHLNFSPIVPKYVWALAALPDWLTDPAMPHLPGEYGKNIRMMNAYQKNMAYYVVQNSKPQQLAPGLIDSPVGLLAWLGWFWAMKLDASPTFSLERMLTVCTIYFCTRSIGTSFLPYHNNGFFSSIHGDPAYNVRHAALGYSDFPDELVNVSHSWLKPTGNLKFYVKGTV
jgi:pimeloyl-ACP methyl ester carboxylesterase